MPVNGNEHKIAIRNSHQPLTEVGASSSIRVAGHTFNNGIGVKGKCALMFKVNGRAGRFWAMVAMDTAGSEDAKGRFRVQNGDLFSNRILLDSSSRTKDSAPQEIDIALSF